MPSLEKVLDTTNPELNLGEYIQAIRDRRIIGLSAVAGYLEDKFQPDYPNYVRARWSRIKNVEHGNPIANRFGREPDWLTIDPDAGSGRLPKGKDMAVIIGTRFSYLDDLWDDEDYDVWPSVAYEYRGVRRAGILPVSFGEYKGYRDAAAMLIGRNVFNVSMGTVVLKEKAQKELTDIRRKDIREGVLYLPDGVEVADVMPADELPPTVPLA